MRKILPKAFVTKAVVLAMTVTVAAPLLEACVISVPFLGNLVIGDADEDEIEDVLEELEDLEDDD